MQDSSEVWWTVVGGCFLVALLSVAMLGVWYGSKPSVCTDALYGVVGPTHGWPLDMAWWGLLGLTLVWVGASIGIAAGMNELDPFSLPFWCWLALVLGGWAGWTLIADVGWTC